MIYNETGNDVVVSYSGGSSFPAGSITIPANGVGQLPTSSDLSEGLTTVTMNGIAYDGVGRNLAHNFVLYLGRSGRLYASEGVINFPVIENESK
jgi:hypothetical protein